MVKTPQLKVYKQRKGKPINSKRLLAADRQTTSEEALQRMQGQRPPRQK